MLKGFGLDRERHLRQRGDLLGWSARQTCGDLGARVREL